MTLTFAAGTNPDIAQVQVQNKLQLATPLLPAQVQQAGIRVTKSSNGYLLIAGFVSTDNSMSQLRHRQLRRLALAGSAEPDQRRGQLQRVRHAVRDAHLARHRQAQQLRADAGRCERPRSRTRTSRSRAASSAGRPAPATQRLTATITEATLLRTPAEFGNILLKVNPDGSQVRIRDVARVELGAETYFIDSQYNGQPASGIGIQLAPGANALRHGECGARQDRRA